jgi:hypothetical protein
VLDNKVAAGQTIVVDSGTYSGGINFNNATKHRNVTVTTTSAIKSALGTFNRGIPTGADNRPYFSAGTLNFDQGVTGVTVEYLRIRKAATPQSGWTMVASVYGTGNTIRYSELWNATAIAVFTTGPLTFSQLYLHDSGISDGDEPDTHTLFVCRNSGCGGVGGPDATSWSQKILIEYTTFGGDSDGDQIQFSTGDDASGRDSYVEISHVDFNGKVDEQSLDSKGADFVSVHDSNFLSNTGQEGAILGQPIDFVAGDLPSRNWWIYNNVFRPNGPNVYQAINMSHGAADDFIWIWNNVFYSVEKNPWPSGDQRMVGTYNGMPGHFYFVHNTVINEVVGGGCNWAYVSSERSDSVIRNNLFYNVFKGSGQSGAIFTGRGNAAAVSNNYFNSTGCSTGACTSGTSAIVSAADPLVNSSAGDYSPKAGSVLIAAGYSGLADNGLFTPSRDKNGVLRGSTPDIGALQFGSGSTLPPPPGAPSNVRIIK